MGSNVSPYTKPSTFCRRYGVAKSRMKMLLHFRHLNGLDKVGCLVSRHGMLFLDELKFLNWLESQGIPAQG